MNVRNIKLDLFARFARSVVEVQIRSEVRLDIRSGDKTKVIMLR